MSPDWLNGWQWPINLPPGEIDQSEVWLRSGTKFEIHQLVYDPQGRFGRGGLHGDAASHFVNYREGIQHEASAEVSFGSSFIGDRVWVDTNGDGVQNEDEKTGAPGVKVIVSRDGEPDRTATTDADGKWLVQDLTPEAQYTVRFVLPTGGPFKDYVVTSTGAGARDKDSNGLSFTTDPVPAAGDLTYDLGITPRRPASVGDRIWIDTNRDGVQVDGEENLVIPDGQPAVKVKVSNPKDANDSQVVETRDGVWKVEGLTPGVEYTVEFELPAGYKATQALAGDDRANDSNGLRSTVRLAPGENNVTFDLGVIQTASLGDFVWVDLDGDGLQGDNEPAVPDVRVRVIGDNGEFHTTTTGQDGKWAIANLTPGVKYTVEFTKPGGYDVTKSVEGKPETDSNGLVTDGIVLKPGENNRSIDLGLVKQTPTESVRLFVCGGLVYM